MDIGYSVILPPSHAPVRTMAGRSLYHAVPFYSLVDVAAQVVM